MRAARDTLDAQTYWNFIESFLYAFLMACTVFRKVHVSLRADAASGHAADKRVKEALDPRGRAPATATSGLHGGQRGQREDGGEQHRVFRYRTTTQDDRR